MNSKFKDHEGDENILNKLKTLASRCLNRSKSAMIDDAELPLIICLNHPEEQFRLMAVKQLFEVYDSEVHSEEMAFFREAILTRLKSDEPVVIKEILKHPKVILNILTKEDVLLILEELSMRVDDTYNLSPLYMKVLKGIDSTQKDEQKLFFSVLAQVFTAISTRKSKAIFRFFQDDDYKLDHPILSALKKSLASVNKLKEEAEILKIYLTLIENISKNFNWDLFKSLWDYQNSLMGNHILKFIALLILYTNCKAKKFDLLLCLGITASVNISNHVESAKDFLDEEPLPFMLKMFLSGMKEDKRFDSSLTSVCYSYLLNRAIQMAGMKILYRKLIKAD